MNLKFILARLTAALLCLGGTLIVLGYFYPSVQPSAGRSSLALQTPTFVRVAKAEDAAVASTISDEAGVSAYFQTPSAITLSTVRSKFRTIERETADYIIGSVPLKDYPESYDVHVYVHKDGWILAYYLKQDPASKIFDSLAYDNNGATTLTTKLENAITVIANAVGVPFTTATYYDFRYPNASHLMLIAEAQPGEGSDSFQVSVPENFLVFERSWSLSGGYEHSYYLNENLIYAGNTQNIWDFSEGTLTVAQLLPGQFHTIRIQGRYTFPLSDVYGSLALVYKEQ